MSTSELYKKYRPRKLEQVLGQEPAVKTIKAMLAKNNIPHALLFHGPSGTGKTTMARILARQLGIGQGDCLEINCGSVDSPLDMVRQVQRQMHLMGMSGKCRMWILDEVQSFSRARFAQEGLLKILEDTPEHVYFALCTTDPNKIIKAVKGRCTPIQLKGITPGVLKKLVTDVAAAEEFKLSPRVCDKVCELANTSARNALVYLEQAMTGATEQEQVDAIAPTDADAAAFDLVKALIPWKGKPSWASVKEVLLRLQEEDAEGLRNMVLASAKSMLLKTDNPLAYLVLVAFEEPFHYTGHAGLARACFEVCSSKS